MLVVDDSAVTTGNLVLTTDGLGYVPVISTNSGATLTNMSGATVVSMNPCTVTTVPCPAANVVQTVTGFTQNGVTGFTASYNLSVGSGNSRWAAGTVNFLDAALFNAGANDLVLSVNDGASYYKIDVVDVNNRKVTLKVTVDGKIAITGALLDSAGVPSVDKTRSRVWCLW